MNENVIKTTTNYSQFKKLQGNREVSKSRKAAILSSIHTYGYIGAPILVNEKMEVIDGQGRLSACEELGVPIPYCMKSGNDINACMILNQNTRNWTNEEYVRSYAAQGNSNYKRLLTLMDKYDLKASIVAFAASGKELSGQGTAALKIGEYVMSCDEYAKADYILNRIAPMMPAIRQAGAHTSKLTYAIMYALNNVNVNYERLCNVITTKWQLIPPMTRREDLLEAISDLYNYGMRNGRIFLKEDYQRENYGEA